MGGIVHHRVVEPAEAHLHGAGLHPCTVQHVLDAHAGPQRIAHGAVRPLATSHTRLEETARIAGALVHRRELDAWKSVKNVLQGQGKGLVYMPPHGELERAHVDLCRDDRPMPADVELIVRREHALVEDVPRSLQQGRARPLQDHRSLLWKGCRDRPRVRPSGQRQIDHRLRRSPTGQKGKTPQTGSTEQTPACQQVSGDAALDHLHLHSLLACLQRDARSSSELAMALSRVGILDHGDVSAPRYWCLRHRLYFEIARLKADHSTLIPIVLA